MVAVIAPNDECGARDPRARVGRRSRSNSGPAGLRVHPGFPGIHAGRVNRGSTTATPPRLELRAGGSGLCRHLGCGCSHDLFCGRRCRRLRRSIAHGHRAKNRRDRFAESGCRGRSKPSNSRSTEYRVFAIQFGFDATAHRGDDVAPQSDGEFRAADGQLFCELQSPDGYHDCVVAALLPRHGFGAGRLCADPWRLPRAADEPGRVPGEAGTVGAGTGGESPRVVVGAELRLRPGRPQNRRQ